MSDPIRTRPTPWQTVLLPCGTVRPLDGWRPWRREEADAANALRGELKAQGHGRGVRIIETRCLGLCPKKAVTALNASAPNQIMTIPRGTPVAEALAQVMPPAH